MKRGLIGALALFATVLVAGCGGSGGDETTAGLTKAEFIKRGDAICRAASEERASDLEAAIAKRVATVGEKPVTAAEREDLFLKVALPPLKRMVENLAALEAPDPSAAAMIKAYERTIVELEDQPQVAEQRRYLFGAPSGKAKAYGFEICSQV